MFFKEVTIMYERSKHLLSCYIAGFTYYDGLDVINELEIGTHLILKAEPNNPYDPEAIVIYYCYKKIGYIPRTMTSILSELLYFGYEDILTAQISAVDLEAHPERQVRIVVKIIDNRACEN